MFPIRMLLKTYSITILMIDIMWVMLNTMYAILQAVYEFIRPPQMKSVQLERALVRYFTLYLSTF